MLLRLCSLATPALVAVLALPATAPAATQLGSDCAATTGAVGTIVQVSNAPGEASYEVPFEAGVITRWSVNQSLSPTDVPTKLKILRPTGDLTKWLVVGQSALEQVHSGTSTFATRIPARSGDVLGTYSTVGSLVCAAPTAGNSIALQAGPTDDADGSTITTGPTGPGFHLALSATLEPDADKDGYGDETQDKCPTQAAIQADCAPPKLTILKVGSGSKLRLIVTCVESATVTVAGKLDVSTASKGRKKAARQSKVFSLTPVTKTVGPGLLIDFGVRLPSKAKKALRQLKASKSAKLTLSITAKGALGPNTSVVTETTKLKGTKPRQRR